MMWKSCLAILLLAIVGTRAQSNLWTGNFTNDNWLTGWFTEGSPTNRGILFGSSNIVRYSDASAPGGGYLRISYPSNSYAPSAPPPAPIGGTQFYGAVLHTNGNDPRDALTLQYAVRFPTNFNFVNGGKLPGLYGGTGNTGTNAPDGTNGFTTRFMWRANGDGEMYPFLPDSTNGTGTSLGRGNWRFTGDNQWHILRQDVILNDHGASNGLIRIWYDGLVRLEETGLFFRNVDALKLDGVLFQTFFGGGDPSYATPTNTYADFAAFTVSALNETGNPLLLSNYQAVVLSQHPSHYFKLDESLTDAVTGTVALQANGGGGGYGRDYFTNASKARFFADANDALLASADLLSGGGVTNASATGKGSVTLLFRTLDLTNTSQAFVFSQGTSNGNAFALFFENSTSPDSNSLKLKTGNRTAVVASADQLWPGQWYFFAVTFDEAANKTQWYLGPLAGPLDMGTTNLSDSAVIGDNGTFYIGNNAGLNNSFRNSGGGGRIDEFAVWDRELTPREITNQFNATFPFPRLMIDLMRPNVVLSWATNTPPGLRLEFTSDLVSTGSWSSVVTPPPTGDQYKVTNSATTGRRFYRLRLP